VKMLEKNKNGSTSLLEKLVPQMNGRDRVFIGVRGQK